MRPVPTLVVERSSSLARSPDDVWARVTTPAGINDELAPWMRMTIPRRWDGASLADVEPPSVLGRSWVLLFGVIPFDYDHLGIDELGERSFRERSTMLSARRWQHERWVEPDEGCAGVGCVVRDRLEFLPRRLIVAVPGGAKLHRAIVTAMFAHRHRRLVAWSRRPPTAAPSILVDPTSDDQPSDVPALIDPVGRRGPRRRARAGR